MRKHSFLFILSAISLLILLSLFSGCLPVTPEMSGSIYGYVAIPDSTSKDLTGNFPVPGASVTITDAEGKTHTVLTDENGYYVFTDINISPNSIIHITKDTADGGKLIFLDIVPQAVSREEDYDAGIANALSTAIALVLEELVNLGLPQQEVDLSEITSSPGFNQLKENIEQKQQNNQDINTNSINTRVQGIADTIFNNPNSGSTPAPTTATADLTGLALSGSPDNYTFSPATYTYQGITVANAITGITVTPTGAGTITVDGTEVTSGNPSGVIELAAGIDKTITVVATETGKTEKTYTIKVTRKNSAQATPTFNPPAGAIAFGTTVSITSTDSEAIYYTTDGSIPTTASTNQATTPLVINSACTVKALAVKAGSDNSAIGSAVYTQAIAITPTNIVLAAGSSNPVGGVTNVAIPASGGTDTTGAVTGWVTSTADTIKFTVTDSGDAVSTIKINNEDYTSGGDYTISSASTLTIVVTTTETGKKNAVRTFEVTVAVKSVTGITVSPTSLSLGVGESGTITETVKPADAANKTVTWSSDNESVATVVDGVVTLKAAGTATITATTEEGGYTATCSVVTCTAKNWFTFDETTGTITNYNISGGRDNVVIPSVIDGTPVEIIGDAAFKSKYINSIVIPDSVTTIGNQAFYENNLTSVTIGNGVTSIGDEAFYRGFVNQPDGSNYSVTIPDSVTTIGKQAFYYNDNLTSVTIGNGVTSIGDGAFYRNALTSVTFGNSVASIGDEAFYDNKLSSITLPDSVTSIGSGAFEANGLTSVTIGDKIETIGSYAFCHNALTSVTIGNNINNSTSIGLKAFYYNDLTSITIGSDVTIDSDPQTMGDNSGFQTFYNDGGKSADSYYYSKSDSEWTKQYAVLDTGPAGGLIFYDDEADGVDDIPNVRYLEAAPYDQSTGALWGCSGTEISGADGIALGTGEQNTIDIEARCSTADTAADICANLVLGGYDDWFLPSRDELNPMYTNLHNISVPVGDFADDYYWSSSEDDSIRAWFRHFGTGSLYDQLKTILCHVRAVRAF